MFYYYIMNNGFIIGIICFIMIVLIILGVKKYGEQEHFAESCSTGTYKSNSIEAQANGEKRTLDTGNFPERPPDSKCGPCICPKINIKDLKCNSCDSSNYVPKSIYDSKVKQLENKAFSQKYDCDKGACAEMARKYPGTICSTDKSPCLWIQKEVKLDTTGMECPKPAPCPPAQTSVITVEKPNPQCNNTYSILPVEQVTSIDRSATALQTLLDKNKLDNLTDQQLETLNQIKTDLNQLQLMSRSQLKDHHITDHKHLDVTSPAPTNHNVNDTFVNFKIPGEKNDRKVIESFESGINYSDFF